MSNRLTRRRNATLLVVGCLVACMCPFVIPGASASTIYCQIYGEGDTVTASSSWTWEAGTVNLAPEVPDVTCGEYLSGGYSSRIQGEKYQAVRNIDNEEIMNFSTQVQADGIKFGREGLMVFETGGSGTDAVVVCGDTSRANETAYNQAAGFNSRFMGGSVSYQSQGSTIQADDTILDQLTMKALATGDGAATLNSWSFNQQGVGNTSAIGYQSETSDRIKASGRDMQAGMQFQWTSFANMWGEVPV